MRLTIGFLQTGHPTNWNQWKVLYAVVEAYLSGLMYSLRSYPGDK